MLDVAAKSAMELFGFGTKKEPVPTIDDLMESQVAEVRYVNRAEQYNVKSIGKVYAEVHDPAVAKARLASLFGGIKSAKQIVNYTCPECHHCWSRELTSNDAVDLHKEYHDNSVSVNCPDCGDSYDYGDFANYNPDIVIETFTEPTQEQFAMLCEEVFGEGTVRLSWYLESLRMWFLRLHEEYQESNFYEDEEYAPHYFSIANMTPQLGRVTSNPAEVKAVNDEDLDEDEQDFDMDFDDEENFNE